MEKKNPAVEDMIARYKQHLREHGLADELYKWELLGKFRGRPDVEAIDLAAEFQPKIFANLVFEHAPGTINHLAKDRTESYRAILGALLDEGLPLTERIKHFSEESNKLYDQIKPKENLKAHHDERTAAAILTVHDPDKYTFYQWTYYDRFCKLLQIKSRPTFEGYTHYLELVKELIEKFIATDKELLELTENGIPANAYHDPNHLLLAQNILYLMLHKPQRQETVNPNKEQELKKSETSMKSKFPLNQILYGPPGTGKTFNTINKALEIMGVVYDANDRPAMKRIYNEHVNAGRIVFTTFHQSMSYEDFVEGIKPQDPEGETPIFYDTEDGIFKEMSVRATKNFEASQKLPASKELTFESAFDKLMDEWNLKDDLTFQLNAPLSKPSDVE